jgi:hypothetical protein
MNPIGKVAALATASALIGSVLIAVENVWGWVFYIIADAVWIKYNLMTHTEHQIPVWLMFIVTAILGMVWWTI